MPEPIDPRISLANERTLLSWMRCALALVAAGTTAGTVVTIHPQWLHAAVAVVPIGLGLAAALLGFARWQRVDTAVRTGVEIPANNELRTVSFAIALIAIIAGVGSLIGVFSR